MQFQRHFGSLVSCSLFAAALSMPAGLRAGVDESGFIVDWLVWGPLATTAGCCPDGLTGRLDYLSDGGSITESNILPKDQDEVLPDFNGAAASTGFHTILGDVIPVWSVHNTIDPAGDGTIINVNPDTVDFNLIYGPGFDSANQGCPAPVENAVGYAVCYIKNSAATGLKAMIELGSDDSIQVKIDDCEAFYMSVGRGFGGPGAVQNRIPVTIPPGSHRLFVKVFNGCGGFGFRLRFVDPVTSAQSPLEYGLDPVALAVPELSSGAVQLDLVHTATPDRLLGLENPVTVSITGTKVDPGLSDDAEVTVTETLAASMAYEAGSAVPAPTSVSGQSLTWKLTAGALTTTGITFSFKFLEAGCGTETLSGCVAGEYSVTGSPCTYAVTGKACSVAVPLNAIFLGSIIGGGDGTGPKAEGIGGVRLDMDSFLSDLQIPPENNRSNDADNPDTPEDESLIPFQPITDLAAEHPDAPGVDMTVATELIDGTFFMPAQIVEINSAGVQFEFAADDPQPDGSWNHILSNITHDIDKGVGNIRVAGREPFATGVGVHASAGVTFDLNAIRAKFGAAKVKYLSTLAGVDGCGAGDVNCGLVNLYIIYSNEDEVLVDFTYAKQFDTDQGEDYLAEIPAEAAFLTFATGRAGTSDCCDHGVFAEARIFADLPVPKLTATPDVGPAPLVVNFSAAGSTAPAGETLSCYLWDFGDGTTGSGLEVSHTYATRGVYTPKLTVQTNKGLQASTKGTVTVNFRCDSVAPYTSTDIGSPAKAGCGNIQDNCITVFGSGKDIGSTSDGFQFVHKEQTGDATVSANITRAIFEPVTKGRAGIMMRDGTAADAPFAYMQVTAGLGGLKATYSSRATTGATVVNKTTPNVQLAAGSAYLRLERKGDEFIGSTSTDGSTWTEFHRVTLAGLPASLRAGFAVTSRDSLNEGKAAEVTFCIESVGPTTEISCTNGTDDDGDGAVDCLDSDCAGNVACPTGKQIHRGDTDQNNLLQLTDAIQILGYLFLGTPGLKVPDCLDAADADDNGKVELTDAVRILAFLFLGGPPPASPGPPPEACGTDTTDDAGGVDLGCLSYPNC